MPEKQYVIFTLDSQEYGIDIMNVREITEFRDNTKLPSAPDFVDGVINLRGNVIPVINLKKRFNLQNTDIDENSRIIIVAIMEKLVGFIVDDASQVITLKKEDIKDLPHIIEDAIRKYIVGIGKLNERIIIFLDLISVLSKEEKEELKI